MPEFTERELAEIEAIVRCRYEDMEAAAKTDPRALQARIVYGNILDKIGPMKFNARKRRT